MTNVKISKESNQEIDAVSWDFREIEEISTGTTYEEDGYVIVEGNLKYLQLLKEEIEAAFLNFIGSNHGNDFCLENAHKFIKNEETILRI